MDAPLCETWVTGKLIEQLLTQSPHLKKFLGSNHLIDIKASSLEENHSFISKKLRVTLEWAEPSPELPKSVIVKVDENAAVDRMLQEQMPKEAIDHIIEHFKHGHNIECDIYELDGLGDAIPMAKCFGAIRSAEGQPGLLLLEDLLLDQGCLKPITFLDDTLTKNEMESVLDTLTSLHAWSVDNTEWRQRIPSLKEFNLLTPLIDRMVKVFPKAKSDFPDIFKDLDERTFNEHINITTCQELFGCDPKERFNLPEVLVYGDMHLSHLVFEKKPGEEEHGDRLIALQDWHMAHRGCAAEDLARIFVVCLSFRERRKHSDEYIKRYVELFNSKVKSADNRITYEDMKRATDEMFSFNGIMWSCGLAKIDKIIESLDEEDIGIALCMTVGYKENFDDAMELAKW